MQKHSFVSYMRYKRELR